LLALIFALCSSVEAQQSRKIPRIGFLVFVPFSSSLIRQRIEAFRHGLRELGYVEGKNVVIEYRYAEGKLDRLRALAGELVHLKVDIIISTGGSATRAAKEATSTIPIVMTNDPDPVGNGHVASLARPGGNITGLSTLAPELSGKRLEILRDVIPKLSHLAVLGTSTIPSYAPVIRDTEFAAKTFGVKVQYLDILHPNDVEAAFRTAAKDRADALLTLASGIVSSQRARIIELALNSRLPAISGGKEFVEAGGLMSYGIHRLDVDRRAAIYVDKILKGAKPAELPVEQPTKFELVINLKTAKQIGLTIPQSVLARADRVIK
jgi:putative tryptophan/tyrosine transport system substrate-binding protein